MIYGLKGREPVGAVLAVGMKGPRGNPVRTDEFFLVSPREGDDGRRPFLPQFQTFNEAGGPDRRKLVRGNLVHATRGECFEHHLRAQIQPGGSMHPDRKAWCTGDGESAERWMGPRADDWRTIVCPNERCEFRHAPRGQMPACRPWMRLIFRLRWPDGNSLPTPAVRYTSMGWATITGALGMFEALERAELHLGATDCPLYGYPILLSLTMRSVPSLRRRYPVVDIGGEIDSVAWVLSQRERMKTIRTVVPALDSPENGSADTVHQDHRMITPTPLVVTDEG